MSAWKMSRFVRWLVTLMLAVSLVSACSSSSQPSSTKQSEATAQKTGEQAKSEAKPKSEEKPQLKSMADIALYQGKDREQILIENAKKEGIVNIYCAMPVEDMKAVTDAFERKYGIKTSVWRSSSENVLQRVVTETKGGRFEFDVVDNNGPELEATQREGVLQKVISPYHKDLIEPAVVPHGEWVGTRINVFTQAYNTKMVKKEDLPKTYEDLLDPKWKGKLAIEAEDTDWFAAINKQFGEEKIQNLFKKIVVANGISVRKGHTLLTQLVASGEVPFALTVYNYKADQLKHKGANIDWFAIEPAIARPNGIAIPKKAPHPFAAILFYDFMISDAQSILAKRSIVPTSKKVDTNLNKMPMKFVDPKIILDENEKWTKLYEEIIIKASKAK